KLATVFGVSFSNSLQTIVPCEVSKIAYVPGLRVTKFLLAGYCSRNLESFAAAALSLNLCAAAIQEIGRCGATGRTSATLQRPWRRRDCRADAPSEELFRAQRRHHRQRMRRPHRRHLRCPCQFETAGH